MKRIFLAALAVLAACTSLCAQNIEEEESEVKVETVGNEVLVDSTLVGKTILQTLPEGVTIKQSANVRNAMEAQIQTNSQKQYSGYRIRIYFDNAQNAREKSQAALNSFKEKHPDICGYRSYDAPNFKVTVGNFRNKTEAEAALLKLKAEYPSAFVVREQFKYPAVGRYASTIDSLKTNF